MLKKRNDLRFASRNRKRRQAFHEDAAVAAAEARVTEHEDAAVVDGADQASGALFQCDDGAGQLPVAERIAAAATNGVESRFEHRGVGRGEWQLVDDNQ